MVLVFFPDSVTRAHFELGVKKYRNTDALVNLYFSKQTLSAVLRCIICSFDRALFGNLCTGRYIECTTQIVVDESRV